MVNKSKDEDKSNLEQVIVQKSDSPKNVEMNGVKVVPKDKQFLNLFWDLSANSDVKRLSSAEEIVKIVAEKQQAYEDDEICDELKYSIQRLIAGLASNRKSSRLGFSNVLTKLLQTNPQFETKKVINLMEEKLKVNTKNDNKDLYIGQVFCLLALVQSNRICRDDEMVKLSIKKCLKLSDEKSYLKSLTLYAIALIVKQVHGKQFKDGVWPLLSSLFNKGWANASSDIIELLADCHEMHPDVCTKEFLQSKKWIPSKAKTANLIGTHSYKYLGGVIADTTQHHPTVSQFALSTIQFVSNSPHLDLGKFWETCLKPSLLTSSPERKYLAIKLAVHSLKFATAKQIEQIWSKDILVNIQYASTDKNALHLYCKRELGKDITNVMKDVKADVQYALLMQLFNGPAGMNMPIISSVVNNLKHAALVKYISWLKKFFTTGKAESTKIEGIPIETARRWTILQMAKLIRTSSLPRYEDWICSSIKFIAFHALFQLAKGKKGKNIEGVITKDEMNIDLKESNVQVIQHAFFNLISCLNSLPSLPANAESSTSKQVVGNQNTSGIMSDGSFWIHQIATFIHQMMTLHTLDVTCRVEWEEDTEKSWMDCMNEVKKIEQIVGDKKNKKHSEARALQLLLLNISLQWFAPTSQGDDTTSSCSEVFEDVKVVIKKRFHSDTEKKNKKKKKPKTVEEDDGPHWVEVITDILLNMLSTGSHGTRVVVDHVFKMMMSHMTSPALQLIADVIDMNETANDVEDDEEMDVDDEQDGEESDEESSSSDEDDDDDDADITQEDNEEFRNKLKEALGDAAVASDEEEDSEEKGTEEDEDEEEVEMDDAAMMKIDGLIAAVFKERKEAMSSKKNKSMKKMELTHFKLRCLDLLETYVARKHGESQLIFSLIVPLVNLISNSSKNPDENTLAEKATVLLRIKICKMKTFPRDLSADVIDNLHDVMEALMKIAEKTNAIFISRVTSQCSLFLLRVLLGQACDDVTTGKCDVARVEKLYVAQLEDFMSNRQSRVQSCLFEDLIHCRPQFAAFLAPHLLKYLHEAGVPYRKIQACQLLVSLLGFPHESLSIAASDVSDKIQEILSQVGDGEQKELKPKYHSQLLKLFDVAICKLKLLDNKDYDVSGVVTSLKENLSVAYVERSQELSNLTWKVLSLLGEKRPQAEKKDKEKKKKPKKDKKKKRKKKNKDEKEEDGDEDEPEVQNENED